MNDTSGQESEAVQAFLKWAHSDDHKPGLGGPEFEMEHPFITPTSLKNYFCSDKPSRLENLLDAVLKTSDRKVVPAEIIKNQYLQCFATLLCIGAGHLISSFYHYDSLQDVKMPFQNQPDEFPSLTPDKFKDFQEKQWQFCAEPLVYDMNRRYRKTDIIPIISREKIAEGGSATVYRIVVHKDYNSLRPPENTRPDTHRQAKKTFVLKSYRGTDAASKYKTERDAHMNLRFNGKSPPSIIACYGGFAHEQSWHIILEHADGGSLENFMRTKRAPTHTEGMVSLWEGLKSTADGVMNIHGARSGRCLPLQILNGWHQDINPHNILVASDPAKSRHDHQFKIGDFELAHFTTDNSSREDVTDFDTFGTRAYGAPETFRSHQGIETTHLQVGQTVDIWSLGCVFSEILLWLHEGWPAVKMYRRQRSQEVKEKGGESGDQLFHSGGEVLDIVRKTHKQMRQGKMVHHKLNREILSLVDEQMLTTEKRAPASMVSQLMASKIKVVREDFDVRQPSLALTSDDDYSETQPVTDFIRPRNKKKPPHARTYTEPRTRPIYSLSHSPGPPGGEDDSDHTGSYLPVSHGKPRVSEEKSYRRHRVGVSGNPNSADSPPERSLDSPFHSPIAAHVRTASEQHQEQACPETPTPPVLTIDEAYEWRRLKKLGISSPLNGQENLTALDWRDHIFLVDNSKTMKEQRDNVARNVVILAYMLKGSDEDGLDIHFLHSKDMINTKTSSRLESDILKAPYVGCSDMQMRLRKVLKHYSNKVDKQPLLKKLRGHQSNPKAPRPLSLYVLTDGIWEPGNDVGGFIKNQAQQMKERGISRDELAIQFIRFGNDPAGIEKLNILDNGLGLRAIGMDFVDHTFWNDNVWKQLLGATNDWYDDDPA